MILREAGIFRMIDFVPKYRNGFQNTWHSRHQKFTACFADSADGREGTGRF